MKTIYVLTAIAIVVLSFFSWSKEEDSESRNTSHHNCVIISSWYGAPIYSCSGHPTHNYSNDSRSGGKKKWLPQLLSILVLASLISRIILKEFTYYDGDAVDILDLVAFVLSVGFVGYSIYYYFSYDDLKVIYWFAAGIPVVVIGHFILEPWPE